VRAAPIRNFSAAIAKNISSIRSMMLASPIFVILLSCYLILSEAQVFKRAGYILHYEKEVPAVAVGSCGVRAGACF
jgi:hypothetical protein